MESPRGQHYRRGVGQVEIADCDLKAAASSLNAPGKIEPSGVSTVRTESLRSPFVLGRRRETRNNDAKLKRASDGGFDLQRRVLAVTLGRLALDAYVELESDRVDQVDQGVEGRIGALAAQEP
jgi:hypothetical protein